MKTLTVTAAPGVSVPKEDKARHYITGTARVTVPDTAYYRRRIADGDLIEHAAPTGKEAKNGK